MTFGELATLGALLGHRPPGAEIIRRIDDRQWLSVLTAANRYHLGPALYAEAKRGGWLARLPADVGEYLADLHALNAMRNARIREQLIECLHALNGRSITPLLLKGAVSLFAGETARILHDIDLAMRREDLDTGMLEISRLGYRLWTRRPSGRHCAGVYVRAGDPAALDIHVRIIERNHLLPSEEVWSTAEPVAAGGVSALVPSAESRVLHVILHAMVHDQAYMQGTLPIRAIYDLQRLTVESSQVDWKSIRERLRSRRALCVLDAIGFAGERLFGLRLAGAPAGRHAARLFYFRGMLRHRGILPERLNVLWAAAHKISAAYYFDERTDTPPLLLWRVRRLLSLSRRRLGGAIPARTTSAS